MYDDVIFGNMLVKSEYEFSYLKLEKMKNTDCHNSWNAVFVYLKKYFALVSYCGYK